jgi:adenine-specific DNA-methyltransferase
MSSSRLELTWVGKEQRPRLEPRILLEDPELSYHSQARVTEEDIFDNRLIFGDNLLALKALEQEFAGKVKCIFIDPPYNTGTAFEHYDDGVEHSLWLSLMRDRLDILARLLSSDGSIWITIDDREAHYLKVLCDEVLGRSAFVASCIWQKRYSRENRAAIGDAHDYVLVYAKDAKAFKEARNLLPIGDKQRALYKNPDGDPRGPWQSVSLTAQGFRPNQMYPIVSPSGRIHTPPQGSCWKVIESQYQKLLDENRVYFGRDGNGVPRRKEFLYCAAGLVPWTWWPHEEVGHTDEAMKEMHALYTAANAFPTPKPERLLERVIHIASEEGDLVLDSFAGSGTTGAVAHKMGRRWIMVELGEHCNTHILPRLKQVIDGDDPGGVTAVTGWKGGGGFRYYKLAPSLLKRDKYGQWIINDDYNAEMLAEAMCKHMGFMYAPSDELYWQHGQSTETDFIFVTTQTFNEEAMAHLSEEVGPERSLLVCCTAWSGNLSSFPNLDFRKIPNAVLNKCEFGKDDYSLTIQNLPMRVLDPVPVPPASLGRGADTVTPDMFAATEEAGN